MERDLPYDTIRNLRKVAASLLTYRERVTCSLRELLSVKSWLESSSGPLGQLVKK